MSAPALLQKTPLETGVALPAGRSRHVGLDLGSSSLKRAVDQGDGPRPRADDALSKLRTPRGLATFAPDEGSAAEIVEAARAAADGALGGLAVTGELAEIEGLAAALGRATGARVEAVPTPVALALDAAVRAARWPGDGEAEVVLDLGHRALVAWLVRWRGRGVRRYPLLESRLLVDASRGGLALDRALAKKARVAGDGGIGDEEADEALGLSELKELAGKVRGPLVRALGDGREVEVASLDAREGVLAFCATLAEAFPQVAKAARDARASRLVAAGGLLELGPVAASLASAAGDLAVDLAPSPIFAAARGAALALSAPALPRVASTLSLVARRGNAIEVRKVIAAGAGVPARVGPIPLDVAGGAQVVEVPLLEGDSPRVARVPRPRAGPARLELTFEWSFERGWRVRSADADVALEEPAPERAKAWCEAVAFPFASRREAVPVDVAFGFVATEQVGAAVLKRVAETIGALSGRVEERARAPRFAAVATGDHPQGLTRPRYVAELSPFGDRAGLARFLRERTASPVDGIDAPEALECALERAAGAPWRQDADKVLVVLTDAPPHEKNEPPYCQVDWREQAARLHGLGVRIVPVLVEGQATAPAILKRTRAFLDGIKGDEAVHALGAKPSQELLARIDALASRERLDPLAREMLARVGVSFTE